MTETEYDYDLYSNIKMKHTKMRLCDSNTGRSCRDVAKKNTAGSLTSLTSCTVACLPYKISCFNFVVKCQPAISSLSTCDLDTVQWYSVAASELHPLR